MYICKKQQCICSRHVDNRQNMQVLYDFSVKNKYQRMKKTIMALMAGLCLPVMAQSWLPLKQRAAGQAELKKQEAVILLDSTGVVVADNGSGSFTIRQVIRVQNTAGALKYRVIKYDYDPLTAFAEFSRVTVYKADGTTRTVDLETACDYAAPARAIYWGARQIMIEIGALDNGDIVDYEISKKGFTYALLADNDDERFVPPMRGQFYDIVPFWVTVPTVSKVYTVDMPRTKDIQYEFYQGECRSSIRLSGDRKLLSFSVSDARPFAKEPNMVDLFDVAPKLMMSSTPEWKDKSLWFNKVNEDYDSFAADPETQKKVDELIRGKKTEMEKIAVLTHWVADNMRYSGISMGKGEGYTLHPTKMNFTDRCGVCKDKAALLISMLRMAGFEAYPAMTMAGSRIESIPADHFNHCVTVVKLSNGQYIPLDPTWVPFLRELWSSAEQQQNYLPGIPEGSDLLQTPTSPPENHYFKLSATTSLDANGTLRGNFTVTAEGQSDGTLRRPFTRGFMENWHNAMENELLRLSPQAKMLSVDYGKNPKDYAAGPMRITMKFEIPDYALTADGLLIARPICGRLYQNVRTYLRINTDLEERQYPFKDACSRLVELQETLSLPSGYKMHGEQRNEQLSSAAADFDGSLSQQGNQVKINHRLTLRKRIYDAADWKGFRSAVKTHKEMADEWLVFEKK